MLMSLDAEGMKKDQLHVENTDGVSPYFNMLKSVCYAPFLQQSVE